MDKRISISFLLCTLWIVNVHAQWTRQDSLRLQKFLSGDGEIHLNKEVIKSINFSLPSNQTPLHLRPMMSTESPSLKFCEDLPTLFSDSISKKLQRLTLSPYTIFTKYGEDPIYGKNKNGQYIWPSAVKLALRRAGQGQPLPGSPNQGSRASAGLVHRFSAEDILQSIFSKKGRTRLKNAKDANAWKNY